MGISIYSEQEFPLLSMKSSKTKWNVQMSREHTTFKNLSLSQFPFPNGNLLKLINGGRYLVQNNDWVNQKIPKTFLEHPVAKI